VSLRESPADAISGARDCAPGSSSFVAAGEKLEVKVTNESLSPNTDAWDVSFRY